MQTLYEWDFNGRPKIDVITLLRDNVKQFAPDFSDEGFSETIIHGVLDHQTDIDETITHYAPEWPLEQITIVDRNILRLGVFELQFSPDVPPKVAINEAIEEAHEVVCRQPADTVAVGVAHPSVVRAQEAHEVVCSETSHGVAVNRALNVHTDRWRRRGTAGA